MEKVLRKIILLLGILMVAQSSVQSETIYRLLKKYTPIDWRDRVGEYVSLEGRLEAPLHRISSANRTDLRISDSERGDWFRFRLYKENYLFCHRNLLKDFEELYMGDIVEVSAKVERIYTRGPGHNVQPMLIVDRIYKASEQEILYGGGKRPRKWMLESLINDPDVDKEKFPKDSQAY